MSRRSAVLTALVSETMERQVNAEIDANARVEIRRPINSGVPFSPRSINLADLAASVSLPWPISGHALVYRKQGSSPAGRLKVKIGGEFNDLAPGDRIEGYFEGLEIALGSSSAAAGVANLVVEQDPAAHFYENESGYAGTVSTAAKLLGDKSTSTYVDVAVNTQPAGTPAYQFDASGWKKLRVYVDGQAANTLQAADIIPWNKGADGVWHEQGMELISIPDSASSGYRYRSFVFSVSGAGIMAFEIRNFTPAGLAQLSFIVEGIE